MACLIWPEHDPKEKIDPDRLFDVFNQLSMHPRFDGVLFTLHGYMTDRKTGERFGNTSANFTATPEQIHQLAHAFLMYLKEIQDAKDRGQIPGETRPE